MLFESKFCEIERFKIPRKSLSIIAEHISRKLIEDENESEYSFGTITPSIIFSCNSIFIIAQEIFPHESIKFLGSPSKPYARILRKPKIEDIGNSLHYFL